MSQETCSLTLNHMTAQQKQMETDFFERYALTFSYLLSHSNVDVQIKKWLGKT